MQAFADYSFEFTVKEGKVVSLKQRDPAGETELQRQND